MSKQAATVHLNIFRRFMNLFTINGMIRKCEPLGVIPSTKSIYQNFLKMAWPSAMEALLVSLVGFIDTMMVSSLGKGAIAAVGITTQPKFILLAFIFSLNVGVTAVIARRKGQGDQMEANRVLRAAIILSFIIASIASILGFIFAEPLLRFCGAESSYIADAIIYFKIICVSLVFNALNLTINAAQRGSGYTKIAMFTNIASNIVNIIFNYLLINGIWFFPRLGVKGAAIATMLGAIASCIISYYTLTKRTGYLNLHIKASWHITKEVLSPIVRISTSACVEQVFMRFGFLSYSVIVAHLGETAYATHIICMNIINLSFCFGDGFGIAASALVGQNLGAKRPDLSTLYGKTGQRLAFLVSTLLFIVFIVFRYELVSLFSKEPEIIALGGVIMIIIAFSTHFQTSQVVMNGCLRGAGDTKFVAITSLISVAFLRPLITLILCFPAGLGLYGAWIALIVDQCFRFITSYIRFNNGLWKKIHI